MSTYPLVQVEGALAMPRMRPLNRVPPPFGREWALMPPHFSLRAELQAFYAAFMRTVCLSAEAFRQACRWDLQRRFVPEPPRPAAAPVGGTFNAAQAQQAAADTLRHPVAGAQPARPTGRVERIPPSSHKLAASAVAIGGAVLLTWIVASHTQFGESKDKTVLRMPASPVSSIDASASARLSDERAQHDLTMSGAVRVNQNASAPAIAHAASAPATAGSPDFGGRAHTSTPLRATLTPKATRTSDTTAKAAKGRLAADAKGRAVHKDSGRHMAHISAPHRSAPLVTARHTPRMYPKAADYSPFQPHATSSDDYASLTTYAGTRAAPRPANRAGANIDNTEWVNHVSQRRVTEVPDSFAK